MTRKLLHSFTILVLALFATQGRLLIAQSAKGSEVTRDPLGLRQKRRRDPDLVNSRIAFSQIPMSEQETGTAGMAKNKVYKFRSIDYPGADQSYIYDFNGNTAVGCFAYASVAFTFHGSSYVPLNVPGAVYSCGYGINTSGTIVGTFVDSSNHNHGFRYDGSRYTTVDFPGATDTQAWEISDSGLIVGQYHASAGTHGFLYDNGTFTAIDFPGAAGGTFAYGINFGGEIVGYYISAGIHGFLLKNGSYSSIDFPEALQTYVLGINNTGSISGFYVGGSQPVSGFIYSAGTFHEVNVDGALSTIVERVNNNGTVIGYLYDVRNVPHGMVGH